MASALPTGGEISTSLVREHLYTFDKEAFIDKLSTASQNGCSAAYSTRLLRSNYYGPMVRVRRSSDNAEQDFYGDVFGKLGTRIYATGISLTTWLGGATGFVRMMYDQSGNVRNIGQATNANQPTITTTAITYNGSQWLELTNTQIPSAAMTSNSSGGLVASASSIHGWEPYLAFDLNSGTGWHSDYTSRISTNNPLIYNASGEYGGSVATTDVNGVIHRGEWLQLQLASAIKLNSFYISPRAGVLENIRSPVDFTILGSNNGTTWNVVHNEFNINNWTSASKTFTVTTPNVQSYSYYRIVVKKIGLSGLTTAGFANADSVQIMEWVLNPTTVPLSAGNDTYTYYATWTPTNNTNSNVICEQNTSTLVGSRRAALLCPSGSLKYGFNGEANDAHTLVPFALNIKRRTVMMCNHNLTTGNVEIYDEGVLYRGTTGVPANLNVGADIFIIGRKIGGTEYFVGDINEIIITNNTAIEREALLYFTPTLLTKPRELFPKPKKLITFAPITDNPTPINHGSIVIANLNLDLINVGNGNAVSDWNGYAQATAGNRPLYYDRGGYTNDMGYVNFDRANSQHLNGGSRTLNIATNGGFTAIALVKFTGTPGTWERIFDFGSGPSINNILFARYSNTNEIVAGFYGNGVLIQEFRGGASIVQDEWAIFGVRYRHSDRYTELFKNGVVIATTTLGSALTDRTLSTCYVGRSNWSADSYLSAQIGGLYVFDRYITDNEMVSLSNSLSTYSLPNISRHISELSSVDVRNTVFLPTRTGWSGYFNANASCFTDIQDVPAPPMSFSFWFNTPSLQSCEIVSLNDFSRGSGGIAVQLYNNGVFNVFAHISGNWVTVSNSQTYAINTWYHVVVTVNSNFAIQFYYNGTGITTYNGTALPALRSRLLIGVSGHQWNPFNGFIQDFRVYDYILRGDEVSRIYEGVSMNQSSLQAPTNYLVNHRNWYTVMTLAKAGSPFTGTYVAQQTGSDPYVQYQFLNSTTLVQNYVYHYQRIQDYRSFTCSFEIYTSGLGGSDGGGDQMYFFVGGTSLPVWKNNYNNSNYVDFEVYRLSGAANRGVAFIRNGTNVAQSHYARYVGAARWVSVSITYNRNGNEASWVVNMDGNDIITYTDTNNETWRAASGNYWGIGAWTGSAVMSAYIRRVELTYVPQASSILNRGLTMNSLKRFPEGALTANSSLNCVASASTEYNVSGNFYPAWKAFDFTGGNGPMYHSNWSLYNSTTGAYIGGVSTTVSGVSYSGEWLQIQLPRAIRLFSYAITCRTGYVSTQSPNTWIVAGSNDGTTWTLVDTETNISTWDSLRLVFNVNNSASYTYFRIICTVTGQVASSDRQAFVVSEWELYSLPFTSVKYPIAPLNNEYPPVALTALSGTISGQLYGNGEYTCSVSSSFHGAANALAVFSKSETDVWHGGTSAGDLYNASTGVYAGNKSTTDTSSTVHSGEWVQITLPDQIVLAEFAVGSSNGNGGDATRKAPRDFVILGSNDNGTTWTLIHTTTNFVGWSDATPNTHRLFRLSSTPSRFFTYRMVIKRIGTSDAGAGQDIIFMSEWRLYALPIFSGNSIGSGTYKITSSSTWENGNFTGWKAFNNTVVDANDCYHIGNNASYYNVGAYAGPTTTTISGSSYGGEWLQIELPQPVRLTRYSLLCRFNSTTQAPKTWKIAGSNDNSTWTEVDDESGITSWTSGVAKIFTTTNSTVPYKYYRMICNQIDTPATGIYWSLGEWVLYDDTTSTNNFFGKAPGLIEGLTWKYYNGYLADNMTLFDNSSYRNIGTTTNLSSLSAATNGQYYDNWSDSYSIEWNGYFRANVTGTWTFQAYSDDSCYLWIGRNALSGYTTSNYVLYENSGHPATRTGTIFLVEGVYYPFRMRWGEGGGADYISLNFTPPGGTQTFDGTGYFFSSIGTNQAFPAESAKIIKDISQTNTDGIYYINVNGVSTGVYCLMNDIYDGGGWMMLMKATRGTTFQYSANYWTTINTLNPTDTTRNDADAKFDTFNYLPIKDVMAIWPDISSTAYTNVYGKNGGSLNIQDGWVWKIDNWYDVTLPPYGLTANGQTLNDITYTASSGTAWGGGGRESWRAFNYLLTDGEEWHSAGSVYNTNGDYIGGLTTTVGGVSIGGDYLQMQMSSVQYIDRIGMICRPGLTFRTPKSFVFAGSTDGTTWTNLYQTTDSGTWTDGVWRYFDLTNPGNYSYYRLIVRNIFANGSSDSIQIGELRFFANTRTTALNGFQRTRDAHPNNPFSFNGFSSGIFSNQSGAFRHVFGGGSHVFGYLPPFRPARWGFLFNNEGDFLTNDTGGGIGAGENYSAGSFNGGISRTARVEVYGR